jgi:hypothetical protein
MTAITFTKSKLIDGRHITAGQVYHTERFGNVIILGFDT